jgi:thiol-disulfide isomerase/thioredoxin
MELMRPSRSWATTLAVLLTFALGTLQGGALPSLADPIEAPGLALPDIRDRTHALEAYRGRVVLVNFWASWCPPCIVELPGMQRLAQRLAQRPFAVLAVNVGENKNQMRRALKLTGFDQTVLLDSGSETFSAWGASVFPTSYLIDKAGRIRYEVAGPLDWEGDEAVAAVEALLAEPPLPGATPAGAPCYADTSTNASSSALTNRGGCQP